MARILVVDDEPLFRQTLRSILEAAGHEVAEAADGEECLRRYRAARPDVIMMDIVMPVKEGIETITELRRTDPDLSIIAVTGGGSIGTKLLSDIALAVGATAALAKPVRREDLLSAVDACLAAAAVDG